MATSYQSLPRSCNDSVFGNGKVQMAIEVLLNIFDTGELADLPDANLAPFVIAVLRSLVLFGGYGFFG